MDIFELDEVFSRVSSEEELIEWAKKENKEEYLDVILKNYWRYNTIRSYWETRKFYASDSYLIVKNVTSIKNTIRLIKEYKSDKKSILLCLKNQTYEDLGLLYTELEGYDIKICYNQEELDNNEIITPFCTLDEFIGMRSTIDYYKSLIEGEDLSPAEIITFMYDIVKSLPYHESYEDKRKARDIHTITAMNDIVCVGYCKLLKQLLSELDIKSYRLGVYFDSLESGHDRLIMRVNDEKYGISGLFVFDPTFDSAKDITLCEGKDGNMVYRDSNKNLIQEGETVIRSYDNLCLYTNFFVPLSDYNKKYNEGSKIKSCETMNGKVDSSAEVIKMIEAGKVAAPKGNLDISKFIRLMYKIKLLEGFQEYEVIEEINELLKINGFSQKNEYELIEKIIFNDNTLKAA